MSAEKLEWQNIDLITNGPRKQGFLEFFQSGEIKWTSAKNVTKKNKKESEQEQQPRVIQYQKQEIQEINYSQVPGGVQLLIRVKTLKQQKSRTICFQGFKGADIKPIKEFCQDVFKDQQVKVRQREVQPNGRNWGDIVVTASAFKFEVNEKCMFEVSADSIAGVNPIGKTDLIVEMAQNASGANGEDDGGLERRIIWSRWRFMYLRLRRLGWVKTPRTRMI